MTYALVCRAVPYYIYRTLITGPLKEISCHEVLIQKLLFATQGNKPVG